MLSVAHLITQINGAVDFLLKPFSGFPQILGLSVASLLNALALLTVFKLASNQTKIKSHKKKIFGYLLETGIFKDQLLRTAISQLNLLKHNFFYLGYFLKPVAIMFIPITIIGLQIEYRMGHQPLTPNHSFNIAVDLDKDRLEDLGSGLEDVSITLSPQVELETPALHIYQENRILWRAKIKEGQSPQWIKLRLANTDDIVEKQLVTTQKKRRFGPILAKRYSIDDLIYAAEGIIPQSSAFNKIKISYHPTEQRFLFWKLSPVVIFFILTLAFGFAIKPFLRVAL